MPYYTPTVGQNVASVVNKMGGFAPQDQQNYELWSKVLQGQLIPGVISPAAYKSILSGVSSYLSGDTGRAAGINLTPFFNTYVAPYMTSGGQEYRDAAIDFWMKHKGVGGGDPTIGLSDVDRLTSAMNDPNARRNWEAELLLAALESNPDNMDVYKRASDFVSNIGSAMSNETFNPYYNVANALYSNYLGMSQEQKDALARAGVSIVDPGTYLPDLSQGYVPAQARQRWEPYMQNYLANYGDEAQLSATGSGNLVYSPETMAGRAAAAGRNLKVTGEGIPGQAGNVPIPQGDFRVGVVPSNVKYPAAGPVSTDYQRAMADAIVGYLSNDSLYSGSTPAADAKKVAAMEQLKATAKVKLTGGDATKYNDLKALAETYKTPTEALDAIFQGQLGQAKPTYKLTFGELPLRKLQAVLKLMRDQGNTWRWNVAE